MGHVRFYSCISWASNVRRLQNLLKNKYPLEGIKKGEKKGRLLYAPLNSTLQITHKKKKKNSPLFPSLPFGYCPLSPRFSWPRSPPSPPPRPILRRSSAARRCPPRKGSFYAPLAAAIAVRFCRVSDFFFLVLS